MPVRHNIDVMHVEKNVSDALLSIIMNNAKSKDGLKARKDLEDMGIMSNSHPEKRGKRTYLPPAAFWLSKEEKKKFSRRLSKFRWILCKYIQLCLVGSFQYRQHEVT